MTSSEDTSSQGSKFEVALRIRHPSIGPEEITSQLSWQPSFHYKVGEPRITPKGSPIPGRSKESFWFVRIPADGATDIPSVVTATNKRLSPYKTYLDKLVDTGGSIEYFIGWFLDENVGDTFTWELLQECARLRVDLAFDIYGSRGGLSGADR